MPASGWWKAGEGSAGGEAQVQAGGLPVRKLYVAHCGNACAEPQWQRGAALGFQWKVERLYSSVYAMSFAGCAYTLL